MIRHSRMWALTVTLAASLLPGCLSDRTNLSKDTTDKAVQGGVSSRQGTLPQSIYDQRDPASTEQTSPTSSAAAPPDTQPKPPPPPVEPPPQRQPAPIPPNRSIQQVSVKPSPPPPPEEPLLAALRFYRERKPALALDQLGRYDPSTREMLALLLPLAARISDIPFDKARADELAAHLKGIGALIEELRPRASLTIDNGCFCRRIKTFGEYEPLPEEHVFRCGDPVQVYLELRNLSARHTGPHYETILTKTVKIYDSQGLPASGKHPPDVLWQLPVQIHHSRSPRHDWFVNCSFYVPPNLPVGTYKLKIVIQDVTGLPRGAKAPKERRDSREFTFHVDPRGAGLASTAAEQGPR